MPLKAPTAAETKSALRQAIEEVVATPLTPEQQALADMLEADLLRRHEVTPVEASHPHEAFEAFTHEMLRTVAAALGVPAEQITQDCSKINYSNYSSARADLLDRFSKKPAAS